jgi:septum formation protein
MVSGVDESRFASESAERAGGTAGASQPLTLTLTLARLKARAVADRLAPRQPTFVLGCDSVLELDGQALGKPRDEQEAKERWRRMRGREGILHTGHCVVELPTGKSAEAVASTTVRFADVTDDEIAAYVATGEPLHVAGAFTIDGIGAPFVESIVGDSGTVIGLSLPLLRRLLAELGTPITALWR